MSKVVHLVMNFSNIYADYVDSAWSSERKAYKRLTELIKEELDAPTNCEYDDDIQEIIAEAKKIIDKQGINKRNYDIVYNLLNKIPTEDYKYSEMFYLISPDIQS